jgi:hypothetical protein
MIHKIDHVKVYTRNKKNLYPEFFLTYIKIKVGGKLRLNLLNWKYQMVFERKYSAIFVNIKMVLKV